MKTYVSIDIDFFNGMAAGTVKTILDRFFSKVYDNDIPMVAVMNHQQLRPFVDQSGAEMLINVDAHSDLAPRDVYELNCGSWVSYINWRRRGTYTWIHRSSRSGGECSGTTPIFSGRRRPLQSITEWKKLYCRRVSNFPSNLLDDCISVGFVLSPSYCDAEFENVFRFIVRKYRVPYLKGNRDEYQQCARRRPCKG